MGTVYKENLGEIIARRKAFHEGQMKDQILFSVASLQKYPYADRPKNPGGLVHLPTGTPMEAPVDIAQLSSHLDGYFSQFSQVHDDKLPIAEVLNYFGHGIASEILGHPVKRIALAGHSGSVVEQHLENMEEALRLEFHEDSPQFSAIREYLQSAVRYAQGRWFLSPYMMADGIHVLMMLFGYTDGYLMLYDQPDEVHHFCDRMVKANTRFFDLQYDICGSVEGGWICNRSDWNPVRCISINLDDYLLCSNEILQEFGLPYMQRMIDHFGCGLIHYHTSDTRLMKEVAKLRHIKVQVGSDPKLPEPVECLDKIRCELPDVPLTWMRITRDDFVRQMERRELYGNVEYYVSDVRDVDDANALYERSKEYRANR